MSDDENHHRFVEDFKDKRRANSRSVTPDTFHRLIPRDPVARPPLSTPSHGMYPMGTCAMRTRLFFTSMA